MSQQRETSTPRKLESGIMASGLKTTEDAPGRYTLEAPPASLRGMDSEDESEPSDNVDESTPTIPSQAKVVKLSTTRGKRPAPKVLSSPRLPKRSRPEAPRSRQIRENKLDAWFRDLKTPSPTDEDIARVAAVVKWSVSWVENWVEKAQQRRQHSLAMIQTNKNKNTPRGSQDDENMDGGFRRHDIASANTAHVSNPDRTTHSNPRHSLKRELDSFGDPVRGYGTMFSGGASSFSQQSGMPRGSEPAWRPGGAPDFNYTSQRPGGDRGGFPSQFSSNRNMGGYPPDYSGQHQNRPHTPSLAQPQEQIFDNADIGPRPSQRAIEARNNFQLAESALRDANDRLARAQHERWEAARNREFSKRTLDEARGS